MNRKFLVNIAFLILLNLLIKPFWFLGIEVSVQNRLSNEIYGSYFSLLSFSLLFTFLLDFGITNFNNREIARYNHLISRYFSNIIGIKFSLAFLYAGICLIGSLFMGYGPKEIYLLLFLILNQFLSSFILYLRSNINGLLMFVSDSIISVMDKALMILFLGLLLWTNIADGVFKLEWFVYSQTAAYFITAGVALFLVVKKCNYFSPSFDLRYFRLILRKSLPFTILSLLMMVYNRIEPVLLDHLLEDGKTQAGIYAQGFRILEVLSNFVYLFPVLLLPLFSKMLKDRDNINALVSLAASIMLLPVIAIATSCALYGNQIMALLYEKDISGPVFSVLILGIIGISTTYLFGTLLTANGNLKQLNIMAATAVVLNICLNIILIPHYKALGAAFSSLIIQSLTGLFQMFLAFKILKLDRNFKRFTKILLWFFLFFAIAALIKYTVTFWVIGILLIPLIGIVLLFLLKLLNIRELSNLLVTAKEGK